MPGDTGYSLANSGLWVCDLPLGAEPCGSGTAVFGAIPAILIGTALLLAGIAAVLVVAWRRPDRLTLLVALAVLSLAFFVLPTRVHERYVYPFFAVGIILAAISWRWRPVYAALSVGLLANMYVVLVVLIRGNPQISDWLGIGPFLKSEPAIAAVAIMFAAFFAWAMLQLRGGAHARLEADLAAASERPEEVTDATTTSDAPGVSAPVTPAAKAPAAAVAAGPMVATMPTWSRRPSMGELGLTGWFRQRLGERSMRADRSGSLASERGGRLDRLDLWFLVVLVLATMTLRTFRLAEPYQMHFDEVYHARTATEFLQSWRYGLSHDIYEWTHPHLAKYAMALGLVLWGEDDVKATSDLGVPVVAAVVEPRRVDPDVRDGRAGERLHIATGTEIRTYDLRTRALISTIPAPGVSALAIDASSLQLVVGYDDGRVATLDLTAIGPGDVAAGVAPVDLATVAGTVDLLYVTPDGVSVAVGQGDHLDVVDFATGTVVGGTDLAGLVGLADGGNGAAIVATVGDVPDPSAAASVLAELLDGNAVGLRGPAGEPRPDGRDGLAGQQGHPRQGRGGDRRRPARGDGGPGPPAHRRRDRRGRHLRRPGHRLDDLDGRPDGWRARPRLHVGRGRPEAVRHLRRRRHADLPRDRHRGRQAPWPDRSTSGRTRCRASARASSTTPRARWSTSSATPRPRPARSSRRRPSAPTRSGRSTSSSRTGTPSSPTRGSARSLPTPGSARASSRPRGRQT